MQLLRKYWLEIAWGLFAVANIAAIFLLENWETIPFHLVWVSLALLYCVRPWRVAATITVLAIVSIVSGVALATVVIGKGAGYDELTEVPLMASMYLVIVWHARRWQQATEERRRSVERERDFVRDTIATIVRWLVWQRRLRDRGVTSLSSCEHHTFSTALGQESSRMSGFCKGPREERLISPRSRHP